MIKRIYFILAISTILSSFQSRTNFNNTYQKDFNNILKRFDLKGTILILDADADIYYSNDFDWAKRGYLPASTFKIPNTLIALETGIMKNETTIIKWDGKKRDFKTWEKDLTLKEAFRASCVPCYQEIARNIGFENMSSYLSNLGYPRMDVQEASIDSFWLTGKSRISAFQQIDFIKQFYSNKLPISLQTKTKMMQIFEIEKTDKFSFSGKTGWSCNEENNNGWFVGYLEQKGKVYYFALNVEPLDANNMSKFAAGREQAVRAALTKMKLMINN